MPVSPVLALVTLTLFLCFPATRLWTHYGIWEYLELDLPCNLAIFRFVLCKAADSTLKWQLFIWHWQQNEWHGNFSMNLLSSLGPWWASKLHRWLDDWPHVLTAGSSTSKGSFFVLALLCFPPLSFQCGQSTPSQPINSIEHHLVSFVAC